MNSERGTETSLRRGIVATLFWCAAFAFACTWLLTATKLFRDLPSTRPVAIGRITVDGVAKSHDYAIAALFYLLVPVLTILFVRSGRRIHSALLRRAGSRIAEELELLTAAVFALPFLLSPFFFLTTRKELWGIALPPALAAGAVAAIVQMRIRTAGRRLFTAELRPYHWLLIFEGSAWVLFRYLATGKRIAHIPTLLLEVVFVPFFLLAFWMIAVFVGALCSRFFGRDSAGVVACFASGALPMVALPVAALFPSSPALLVGIAYPIIILTTTLAVIQRWRIDPARVTAIIGWLVGPVLLFCVSYASTAHLSHWIDLFHRGEALGPASDYLRGKVPYRDVFVLHGLLDNGLLDSWLMRVFGRSVDVSMTRLEVASALTMPLVWLISYAALRSLPLSILATLLGYVISADNHRAVPQLIAVLLLVAAIRRRSSVLILFSGCVAGFAVFYGLDLGLYSVAGGLLSLVLLLFTGFPARWPAWFAAGVLVGAAPFLIGLAAAGVLPDFFETSFITIPAVIDAAWSLPFPDLAAPFRDVSARTVADFVLTERFRFLLNPLVLGIAATVVLARQLRRTADTRDAILLVVVVIGILTQRSALGRADFQHQYFSAFLLPPVIVIGLSILGDPIRRLWRFSDLSGKTLLSVLAVLAVPIVLTVLWIPDLLNSRLDAIASYQHRIRTRPLDPLSAQLLDRVHSIRVAVDQMSGRDEPVFDFSNQPALYFFTDRPNPTRFYQVPILSPIDLQMEAIEDLARRKPGVVFRKSPENYHVFDGIENDMRAPAVAAFLDDHYAFARNIRGVELWHRVKGRNRPLSEYRRQFTIRPEAITASKQRFVLPALEPRPTDVWIYNPHGSGVQVRLRYLWGPNAAERVVRIASRDILRIKDVTRSFGAPGSRGDLWIEFPADRRPLVRSTTYDADIPGSAFSDPPQFEADSATAHSLVNELTIAGIHIDEHKRVQIGVISTGPSPARFRVTAETGAQKQTSGSVEATIDEDRSYLINDAVQELGIPFREPVVIRIHMLNGRAIAYASVIDRGTGLHQTIPAFPTHAP